MCDGWWVYEELWRQVGERVLPAAAVSVQGMGWQSSSGGRVSDGETRVEGRKRQIRVARVNGGKRKQLRGMEEGEAAGCRTQDAGGREGEGGRGRGLDARGRLGRGRTQGKPKGRERLSPERMGAARSGYLLSRSRRQAVRPECRVRAGVPFRFRP